MAHPEGFEPSTDGLEGRCSIQLSYGRGAKNASSCIPPTFVDYFLQKKEVVGDAGFEPATPWTQTKCATKLR